MGSGNEEDATGSSRSERPDIIIRDDSLVSENSEDIVLHPEVINTLRSRETRLRQGEVVDGNRSRKKSAKHVGDAKTEGESLSESSGSVSFSSTSSRSLSIASSEDLFQVDTSNFIPKLSVPISIKTNEERSPSTSSSQDSNSIHERTFSLSMLPTQTPPTQVMDRSDGYDSSRISSPVIGSNNTTPRGWSATSNDSLFSIQVGATSFSREEFLIIDEQGKSGGSENISGELDKSDNKSGEFFLFSPPIPTLVPLPTLEIDRKSVETGRISDRKSVETARNSEASSSPSVANPVVKKKKSRSAFCSCCNCSWKFCHCSLPSCCSRRPNCHSPDCSWAFCCFSKGSSKNTSSDEEQKKKQKHIEGEPASRKTCPKSSGHKCFPTFNCCRYWWCCRCLR